MAKERLRNTVTFDGKRYVCRIFDNGGETLDRYTIAFRGYRDFSGRITYPYIAASERPFAPQGFGQHGESDEYLRGKHLGKRIAFKDCPPDVQAFIRQELGVKA